MRSSGRSTLLARIAGQLESDGFTVTRISGVRALRDRPLSALAVTGIDVSRPSSLQSLASAVAELEGLLSSGPSVLMVDDADDLDATTVGAIAAVRLRVHIPIVATSRPVGRGRSNAGGLAAELRPGEGIECTASPYVAGFVTFGPRDFHRTLKAKFGLSDR